MEKEYKYTAFISYNSKDNSKARWLQKRLESYSLPSVIANEKGEVLRSYDKKPKKFRIFRYVTDLVAQNLDDGLREELDQSKCLIVICSPNSANAPWVRKEIKHFVDTGRKKQIIPFVIKGVPYSCGKEECFTPELKEAFNGGTALGVNMNDCGDDLRFFRKRKAVAKTVALLLDMPDAYAFLWNRYKHQVIKEMMAQFALILCFAIVIGYVYKIDKVFDCTIKAVELTPVNNYLPSMNKAQVSIIIGGEIKSRVLLDTNDSIVIGDIPQKFYGKYTKLHYECDGYMTKDTHVLICENICLNIERNKSKYGDVFFTIIDIKDDNPIPNETIWIDERKVTSDNEGRIYLTIPFEDQRQYYTLHSKRLKFVDDTIEPPFTESSIIEVIKK